MREIVLDTETTGLDPSDGHRIVEIACIELVHHVPTGRKFHRYVNPERDMPEDALAVHGIDCVFLAGQPHFAAVADDLLAFIGSGPLVIHNAEFDLAFLNAELARLGRAADRLLLCRHAGHGAACGIPERRRASTPCADGSTIDLSLRDEHGAEIDCGLLAAVYLELLGGRQPGLDFVAPAADALAVERILRPPRPHAPSIEELIAHQAMLQTITNPIWLFEA